MEKPYSITLESAIRNRVSMYSFLARVYREEIDSELLDELSNLEISTMTGVPEIDKGYKLLQHFKMQINEKTVTDLAVDYARVFIGAMREEGAFPYESVYTSLDKLIMQDARDQVVKIYREVGLDRSMEFSEPEDHVALELEFMAYLSQQTIEYFKSGELDNTCIYLKKQKDFLDAHLMPWVPTFCSDVQRLAKGDFYKGIALITVGFLEMEQSVINELIDEIQELSA